MLQPSDTCIRSPSRNELTVCFYAANSTLQWWTNIIPYPVLRTSRKSIRYYPASTDINPILSRHNQGSNLRFLDVPVSLRCFLYYFESSDDVCQNRGNRSNEIPRTWSGRKLNEQAGYLVNKSVTLPTARPQSPGLRKRK